MKNTNVNFYLAPDTIGQNLIEPETTFDATLFKVSGDNTGGTSAIQTFQDIATQSPEQIDVKSPQQPVYETGFPDTEYSETPYPSSDNSDVLYTNDPSGMPSGNINTPLPGTDISGQTSEQVDQPAETANTSSNNKYIKILLLLLAVIIIYFISKNTWK